MKQGFIFIFIYFHEQPALCSHAGLAWVEHKCVFTPELRVALCHTADSLFSLLPKAVPSFQKLLLLCFVKDENMLLQHSLHHSVSVLHRLFLAFWLMLCSVEQGRLPSHLKAMMFPASSTAKNKKGLWGARI